MMREVVAERATHGPFSPAVQAEHYEALAVLAAVALILLGIIAAIDRARGRRRRPRS